MKFIVGDRIFWKNPGGLADTEVYATIVEMSDTDNFMILDAEPSESLRAFYKAFKALNIVLPSCNLTSFGTPIQRQKSGLDGEGGELIVGGGGFCNIVKNGNFRLAGTCE